MGEITTNIFLTSSEGFVGSHILASLLASLGQSSVIYTTSQLSQGLNDPRIKLAHGETEGSAWGSEAFVQSAVVIMVYPSLSFLASSLDASKEEMQKKRIICVVDGSSVSKEALVEYEAVLKKSGAVYTIMRAAEVYGRGMPTKSLVSHLVTVVYQKKLRVRLDFRHQIHLIHVNDLATLVGSCVEDIETRNHILEATTETLTVGRMLFLIYEHITGRPLRQLPWVSTGRVFGFSVPGCMPTDPSWSLGVLKDAVHHFSRDVLGVIRDHVHNTGYWLVTGANSGIGYELACRLHAEGKPLLLVDKKIKQMAELKGNRIICADLSTVEGVQTVIDTAKAYNVYVLINNAGLGFKGNFEHMSPDQLLLMMRVNMIAPVLLTQAFLPKIMAHGGTIVNVASSAGHHPLPGMGTYAATKAFVLRWSSALWYEVKNTCSIVTFSPSGTNTKFQEQAGVKNKGPLLSPLVVADHILAAIEKKTPFVFLGWKNKMLISLISCLPDRIKTRVWGELFARMR